MNVAVNGSMQDLEVGTTVADLVTRLGRDPGGRGLAIAVNGEVVPRATWSERSLSESDRVEVLGATQGG